LRNLRKKVELSPLDFLDFVQFAQNGGELGREVSGRRSQTAPKQPRPRPSEAVEKSEIGRTSGLAGASACPTL
jgi:hypothetical protein